MGRRMSRSKNNTRFGPRIGPASGDFGAVEVDERFRLRRSATREKNRKNQAADRC